MKYSAWLLLLLAAGCTVPDNELRILSTSTSFDSGRNIVTYKVPDKKIVFDNVYFNDLDGVGQTMNWATAVSFNEVAFLGSTIQADGRVVATYKLGRAHGSSTIKKVIAEKEERRWHRGLIIEPVNEIINITSSQFAGVPLAELKETRIFIEGAGPNKGRVVQIQAAEPKRKTVTKLAGNKWKVTYQKPGAKGTFEIVLVGTSSNSTPDDSDDMGYDELYLDSQGWFHERPFLGGGSADLSFLEVKSKRGKFD